MQLSLIDWSSYQVEPSGSHGDGGAGGAVGEDVFVVVAEARVEPSGKNSSWLWRWRGSRRGWSRRGRTVRGYGGGAGGGGGEVDLLRSHNYNPHTPDTPHSTVRGGAVGASGAGGGGAVAVVVAVVGSGWWGFQMFPNSSA